MKHFKYKDLTYKFTRYPETRNRSLQAWSAADEYVLNQLEGSDDQSEQIAIYNDRFGFLSCMLSEYRPKVILVRKSQQRSIEQNLALNEIGEDTVTMISVLDDHQSQINTGIISIPKTMDLFQLFLHHLASSLSEEGVVYASFMTKYFTPQMLSIAEEYFEDVEQSMARKKARLLIMKNKKPVPKKDLLHHISFTFRNEHTEKLTQHYGVFSSDHIDYATQFLIANLKLKDVDEKILDVASGNGVIARSIQLQKPEAELHLVDDSFLAIESSKMNLESSNTYFHWDDTLADIEHNSIDLAVSNPPFHFGHETNIEVSIRLFGEALNALKQGGRFVCVANQHLNYKTHLDRIFKSVKVLAQNEKFIVYEAVK